MKSLLAMLLLFATAPSLAGQKNYQCAGTEPFWNAQIDAGLVTVTAPGEDVEHLTIKQRFYPLGTPPSFGEVIKASGAGADALLTIRKDSTCNDGMSEAKYSHEVWFLRGDNLLVGCCQEKK